MSKRWSLDDDIFLVDFSQLGPDFIASHDLSKGKGAGERRAKKLKELGIWEKIEAYVQAKDVLMNWHALAFSRSAEARDIALSSLLEDGLPVPEWADIKPSEVSA